MQHSELHIHTPSSRRLADHRAPISDWIMLVVPSLPFAPQDNRVDGALSTRPASYGNPTPYPNFVRAGDVIAADIVRKAHHTGACRTFLRAGPRRELAFNPSRVRAAILTAGGLCPGMNNVIRELTRTLLVDYGAAAVWGLRDGYNGFDTEAHPPIELTLASTAQCHNCGGTMLRSDRGGFDVDQAIAFVREYSISHLYIIGGDGTHRGAYKLSRAFTAAGVDCAVAGVPKTIDNDVDLIDRSFGFTTAVEHAVSAIKSAKTEATCAPRCIGLVKLMGRHAGFIAVHAALASGDADLVCIPEVPLALDGEKSALKHLQRVIERQGHAVVVIAEGAGVGVLEAVRGPDGAPLTDAGGNAVLPEVGPWLKDKLISELAGPLGKPPLVKYIDPSYTIRSVPANASDAILCLLLAQNAVHGCMAGHTGFSVGLVNNRVVYIPMDALVANSPRVMDPIGRTWERVVACTGQPNTAVPLKPAEGNAMTGRTVH